VLGETEEEEEDVGFGWVVSAVESMSSEASAMIHERLADF
jgi:hypothetical protein